jgi:hypothetical protein
MTPGPRDDETGDDESAGSTRESVSADDERPFREGDEHRTEAVKKSKQDGNWKFPLESLSDGDDEDNKDEGNIAGTLARDQPLEPGDIDPENAFFVALGILVVVGLILGAMFGF